MRLIPCLLVAAWLCAGSPAQTRPTPPVVDPSAIDSPAELPQQTPVNIPAVAVGNTGDPQSAPVPEPGTLLLVGTGLVGVALTARGRRRKTSR